MAYLPPLNGGRINATISGNTAGVGALVSSGTMALAGGNNVTLSQNANSITISAGNGGNSLSFYATGNTTNNTSGSFNASSVLFKGLGGASIGYSNGSVEVSIPQTSSITATGALSMSANGSTLSIGVPAVSMGLSNIGNTSGTSGTVSNEMVLAGGNNVTLSQSTNAAGATITVSAASQSNPNISLFATGNTTQSSSTVLNASNLSFNGLGAATMGFSNGSIQVSAPVQSAQTQSLIQAVYDGANSITTGTVQFSNSNGVSFGINGQTITGSVAAQSAQTGISAISAGTTMMTSGTASFANSNGISFGVNGNTITASYTVPSQSNPAFSASGGSSTFQTLNFANSNGLTFSNSNGSVLASYTVPTQSAQTMSLYAVGNTTGTSSNTSIDARTMSFNGLGAASVGFSSGSIEISVPAQTVQTQSRFNLQITGNTSGTTGIVSSGTLMLAGGNNITLSQSGTSAITISAANQTVQTQNLMTVNGTQGNVSISGGANITVGNNASTVTISAAAQSAQTQSNIQALYDGAHSISTGTVQFSNSNGVSFGISNQTLTASVAAQSNQNITMYATGNTTQNSSTVLNASNLTFNAINGMSVGFSNGSVQLSGATGGGGGGGGIALANSQTTYSSGTAHLIEGGGAITIASTTGQSFQVSVPQTSSLSATGAVSLSTNGSTISIGVPAVSMGLSNIGNTSGNTGTVSNQLIIAGGNNITLSQSTNAGGATVTIAGATVAGANPVVSYYQNLIPQNSLMPYTTLGVTYNTMILQPLSPVEGYGFPGDMTVSTFMMQMSGAQSATSASISSSFSSNVSVGIYLLNNSSQLTLVNSASTGWSAAAATNISTGWYGNRFLTIHSSLWSTTPILSYGSRYWFAIIHGSTNLGTNASAAWLGQYIGYSIQRSGTWGVNPATNTSMGMVPFLGIYATSITSMPGSIGNNQVNKVNISAGFAPSVVLNATFSAF